MIRRYGVFGMAPPKPEDPFRHLLKAIVYQQLSGASAAAIHGRVLGLFPRRRPSVAGLARLGDDELRGAGLSRPKIAAVRDLAQKRRAGLVPGLERLQAMDDDEILARLTSVRGVGPWTVQMLLMFGLGRPDVLPETDLGIRKGYARAFGIDGLPAPGQVRQRAEGWRPWRSVASWYLWRAADGGGAL
ncbi:MAG: DNA-3-methyladenine glycosylase 2 family protein [Gammaproteobacteria bacterium]